MTGSIISILMSDNIKLFFCGDFCSTPSTSLISVSEELKDLISSCDLKICNFEVPLKPSDIPKSSDRLYQHDDAPKFLENLGFNLFSFANNHAFDYGIAGYEKTINAFRNRYNVFGSGSYREAYSVKMIDIKGIKIGFLALCYAARFGVFDNISCKEGLGCAYINDLCVNHVILAAKKEVDFLIILPHDGIEYIDVPLPETIARYRDFIDYGADAVIGTHPHCPQGWEKYRGKLIFYSLGNFFFNSKENPLYRAWNRPHWYEGLCVELNIKDGDSMCEVYNTKNVDNVALVLDPSEDVKKHNEIICSYLKDATSYKRYIETELRKLAIMQELPILDTTVHKTTLKIAFKSLLKKSFKLLFSKEEFADKSVTNLLKNDTRRSALLRVLNNQ